MGALVRAHADLGHVVANRRDRVMDDDTDLGIEREVELPVLEGE